jgi:hypothetical protein
VEPVILAVGLLGVVLLAACAGAAAGYAGGLGGRWTLRARLFDLERGLEGLDRRIKGREGQAGQAVRRVQKTREEIELEALEHAARRGPRRNGTPAADVDVIIKPKPVEPVT